MKVYGSELPPTVDTSKTQNTSVPIALFVGKHDVGVSLEVAHLAKEMLGKAVISYHEVDGGHNIFSIAKNQNLFKSEGLSLIKKYNIL